MEFAKKYALVPEESITKHTISSQQLSDLDKTMVQILNSPLEDHEKVHRYYELLQKKLKMNEYNSPYKIPEMNSANKIPLEEKILPAPIIENENPQIIKEEKQSGYSYDDIILESVPPNLKGKADTALNILKSRPDILSWNNKGEISYHEEKIPHSNIADMFNLIFTNKKTVNIPAKNNFLSAVSELNLPKQYIRNKYLTVPNTVKSPDVKIKRKYNITPKKNVQNWESY